ncbi:MAG: dephospho-CoA kinase [Bacteroidetes bacterium]|nr:dephospho-CoA kinase [Bacteroidota bacterium]
MIIVGITGGIGSGKSTLSDFLMFLNYQVFNSDSVAKAAYLSPNIKEEIVKLLGHESYEGKLPNKKYISQQIFSNTLYREKINSIIHPFVENEFAVFIKNCNKKILFKESALLFETGIYKQVNKIITVTAPLQLRHKWLEKRSSLTFNEINKIIDTQWSDEDKIKLSNYTVINNNIKSIIQQTQSVLHDLEQ